MATDPRELPEDLQRWTSKRRVALVLSILKGETSAVEAARKHGLTVAEVEDWKEKFLLGAENALRSKPRDEPTNRNRVTVRNQVRWPGAGVLPERGRRLGDTVRARRSGRPSVVATPRRRPTGRSAAGQAP